MFFAGKTIRPAVIGEGTRMEGSATAAAVEEQRGQKVYRYHIKRVANTAEPHRRLREFEDHILVFRNMIRPSTGVASHEVLPIIIQPIQVLLWLRTPEV